MLKRKLPHPNPEIILISSKTRLNQLSKPLKSKNEITIQATGKATINAINLVHKLQQEFIIDYKISTFTVECVDDYVEGLDDVVQRRRPVSAIKVLIWKI